MEHQIECVPFNVVIEAKFSGLKERHCLHEGMHNFYSAHSTHERNKRSRKIGCYVDIVTEV